MLGALPFIILLFVYVIASNLRFAANPDDVNGGVNHFGSPFNFPEEFITVYRLHALVPAPRQ